MKLKSRKTRFYGDYQYIKVVENYQLKSGHTAKLKTRFGGGKY